MYNVKEEDKKEVKLKENKSELEDIIDDIEKRRKEGIENIHQKYEVGLEEEEGEEGWYYGEGFNTKDNEIETENFKGKTEQEVINKINTKYNEELKALEQSNTKTSLESRIKDLEDLGKENLKSVSDKGLGKEIKTWDKLKDIYKNEEDISLIFSKFEQLKTETKKSTLLNLKKELKNYFDESINTPVTQRVIIDNKEIEEIAKQYTINCK
jgi:hypothetical protein